MQVDNHPAAFKQQGNQGNQGPENSRRPGSASHPGKHLGQMKKASQSLPQIDRNALMTLLQSLLNQQSVNNQPQTTAANTPQNQATTANVPDTASTVTPIATSQTGPVTAAPANTGTTNLAPPTPTITPVQNNVVDTGIASGANNPLDLSATEQSALHQILGLNAAPNNPQINQILDTNPSGRLDAGDTVVSQRPIDGTLTNQNHVLTNAQVSEFINQRSPGPETATLGLTTQQQDLLRQDYQLRNVSITDSNNNGQLNTGDLLSGTRDPDPLRFFDETHVQFQLNQEMVNKLLLS